ncbi:hypothetical protein Syun_022152 [Stephania yunnanensis]|uniref:F-box domain-containing protein n=1 Tax=Stephania yunnanensis TaxID=152371 RepID=A0AAP0IHE6_9MAGN
MELNSGHKMEKEEYLPEEIMDHIFSFLSNPKDLIQTSLVAKRWRRFWVSAPATALVFDVNGVPSFNFYNRFFEQRRRAISSSPTTTTTTTTIQILNIQYQRVWKDRFRNSISLALSHHVQQLCIYPAPRVGHLSVPISLFSAPNLKTLTLDSLYCPVQGEFPVTCPDLQSLLLNASLFGGFGSVLALRTPKLNKLEVCNVFDFKRENLLKLRTPKLSSLSFTNRASGVYGFTLVSTFEDIDIYDYEPALKNMHLWFNHSRSISKRLRGSRARRGLSIDAASHARVSAKGKYPGLEKMTIALGKLFKLYGKLRSLELRASFELPENIDRFASLLMSNCSSIELLIIKVVSRPKSRFDADFERVNDLPVSCTLNKLKYIVVQVKGLGYELELFRFLLHSAVNLQRMAIAWKRSKHQIGVFEQFSNTISQEYPRVQFLFRLS